MPTGNSSWPSAADNPAPTSPQDADTFATGLETLGQYIRDLRAFQVAIETDLGVSVSPPTGTVRAQIGVNAASIATLQASPFFSILSQAPVLTYNQFPDRMVVQRLSTTGGLNNLGVGTLVLKLTCPTLVGLVEYQLRDAVAGGNPVTKPYATVGAFVQGGPVGAIAIVITDFPAALGWSFLDVRINGGGSTGTAQVYGGTRRIGCGEVIGIAGSDLAVDFISNLIGSDTTSTVASTGVTPSANSAGFATTGLNFPLDNTTPASWSLVGDSTPYKSSQASEFLRLVALSSGVNAALIGHAVSVTTLSAWLPGQGLNTTLKTVLSQAGGAFGGFLWLQGSEDAASATVQASYLSGLQTFFSDLAASFPSLAFCRLLSSVPAFGATTQGSVLALETIRAAALSYQASDPLSAHVDGLDVTLGTDLFHPTQAGGVTFARHFYRSWRRLRLGATGNTGPRLVSATRASNSAQIVVTLSQGAGTDLVLSGVALNQFEVFASGDTATPLALTSLVKLSPTSLQLTLTSAPANSVALDVRYRDAFLDTSVIVSNSVTDNWAGYGDDGVTSPTAVRLLAAPVAVAAPGGGTGGGSGAFPAIAPALVAHYDASASGVLFSDAALSVAQTTASGVVAGWMDSSSTAAHLTNTVGGSSFAFLSAGSQNGLNGVRFVGASKSFLRNRVGATWQPLMTASVTVFIVFKALSTPNSYMFGGLYNSSSSSGPNNLLSLMMVQGSAILSPLRNSLTQTVVSTGPSYPATGTLIKAVVRFDLPNNLIYCAMNAVGEFSAVTKGPYTGTGMANWDTFSLGEMINRFYILDGTIYETAVWNGLATTTERDALITYASNKWGF